MILARDAIVQSVVAETKMHPVNVNDQWVCGERAERVIVALEGIHNRAVADGQPEVALQALDRLVFILGMGKER